MVDDIGADRADRSGERRLWRNSWEIEVSDMEAERFLDFAGLAEDRLDPDEVDRVEALLRQDAAAHADVVAARELFRQVPEIADDAVIARACALVPAPPAQPQSGDIVPFPSWRRGRPRLPALAQWASIAAAVLVTSWLGFAMGSDTWMALGGEPSQASDDGLLHELVDPSIGFMRDLTEGNQT